MAYAFAVQTSKDLLVKITNNDAIILRKYFLYNLLTKIKKTT